MAAGGFGADIEKLSKRWLEFLALKDGKLLCPCQTAKGISYDAVDHDLNEMLIVEY